MARPRKQIVKWLDSMSMDGWTQPSKIKLKCSRVTTLGYVVKENDNVLCLAGGYDKTTGAYHGLMFIPKVAILSRKNL